tara:strand:- start:91 stop:780 length:690 start_codon:yes stop_codon:yes gene_type:complete
MKANQYKKILSIINKDNYSKFDLITNYGLFSGTTNLYKTLKLVELINSIKDVKGDIIEFGTHKGNTGFLIAKILKLKNIKKNVYIFDSFKGLQDFDLKDDLKKNIYQNKYKGNLNRIIKLKKFFQLSNLKIINEDALKISDNFFNKKIYSLIYFDMDLYIPTINILNNLNIKKNLSKFSKIVFDQGNSKLWKGEKKAMNEFYKKNIKFFSKKIISKTSYHPDVVLIKNK